MFAISLEYTIYQAIYTISLYIFMTDFTYILSVEKPARFRLENTLEYQSI